MLGYFRWLQILVYDKSSIFIVLGLLFYALTTPCPHKLGLIQVAVALCLAASVIASKPRWILSRDALRDNSAYLFLGGTAQFAAIIFFIIAVFGAVSHLDSGLTLWMLGRDILPYFFLILPLLFTNIGHGTARRLTIVIPIIVSFVGVVYSLKFIGSVLNQAGSIPHYLGDQINAYTCNCVQYRVSRDAYCFPFDPAVQFSAVFLMLRAVKQIASANKRAVLQGVVIAILSALPIMAISLLLNRAMLGLICVALVVYCATSRRRIFAAIVVASVLTITILAVGTLITVTPDEVSTVTQEEVSTVTQDEVPAVAPNSASLSDALLEKQKLLGFNNKAGELISLFQDLSKSSWSLVFGLGWGGQFYSPAVGQVASFTHSLISYAVLKAGFLGLLLLGIYLLWIACTYFKIKRPFRRIFSPELYAINCVILISLLFQPTYKTPTYGVLLLFVLAAYISTSNRDVHDEA